MGRKSRQKSKSKGKRPVRAARPAPVPAEAQRLERALLGCALVGLAFSAILYADYAAPGSGLCSLVGGGCDAVRASGYSSVAGVSVPTLGIAYFLTLLTATLAPALRPALAPLALVGAGAGITFLGLQAFAIGAWCPFCVVVDLAAIGAGVCAWMLRGQAAAPPTFARVAPVAGLALVALALVNVGGGGDGDAGPTATSASDPVPAVIAELQKEAPITVVEFLDFQCPACGAQHRVFSQVLDTVDYDVNMVYLHAPLPQHPYAADAARAYLCAAEQEQGAAMADALFLSAEPSPAQIQQFAVGIGLDADAFSRCLMAQSTGDRMALDERRAGQAGLRSLPTFWIGTEKFVGVQEADVIYDALDRLARRAGVMDASGGSN